MDELHRDTIHKTELQSNKICLYNVDIAVKHSEDKSVPFTR